MKRYLLDTHVLLWWLGEPKKLSEKVLKIISEEKIEIFLSAASLWEIETKREIGKLKVPKNLAEEIKDQAILELEISGSHVKRLAALPKHHKDPFDRMIIAQALEEDLVIISSDPAIHKYSAQVIWW